MIDNNDIEQLKGIFAQRQHVHSGSDTPQINYNDLQNKLVGARFGGDGSDGVLNISSGTTTVDLNSAAIVYKNYTSISITGTGQLAFSNPNTNGTYVVLRSKGNFTVTSSTSPAIDVSGMGASSATDGTGILS